MRKNFSALKAKMSPSRQARVKARAKRVIAGILLGELRQLSGLTQNVVAKKLGIKQPSLSKLETQDDMYVSTLQRLVEALGGSLELVAHMPKGDIKICPFGVATKILHRDTGQLIRILGKGDKPGPALQKAAKRFKARYGV